MDILQWLVYSSYKTMFILFMVYKQTTAMLPKQPQFQSHSEPPHIQQIEFP